MAKGQGDGDSVSLFRGDMGQRDGNSVSLVRGDMSIRYSLVYKHLLRRRDPRALPSMCGLRPWLEAAAESFIIH